MGGPCFTNNGTTAAFPARQSGGAPIPLPKGWTAEDSAPVLHISTGPSGPWKGVPLNATGLDGDPGSKPMTNCNNPSPFVLPDGSVALLCKEGYCHHSAGEAHSCHTLFMADRYDGVYRNVTTVPTGNEDPFLWVNKRGWHVLFHTPLGPDGGTHAFSKDGLEWHGCWTKQN